MDIERLKKIKEICFKKEKNKKNQRSKSPLIKFKNEKENEFTQDFKNKKPSLNTIIQKDPLKNYEEEIIQMCEKKSSLLEKNLKNFKESIKNQSKIEQKQQKQEIQKINCSPLRLQRFNSPFLSQDDIKENFQDFIQRSNTPDNKLQTQLFQKEIFNSQQNNYSNNIQKSKNILLQLLKSLRNPQNLNLLPCDVVQQIQLRIEGSFERLNLIQDNDQQRYLLSIIQNCFMDLQQKIEQQMQKTSNANAIKSLKTFITDITDQILTCDLEDSLPDIIKVINSLKIKIGCLNLTKINKQKIRYYFNTLKIHTSKQSKIQRSLKNIYNSYIKNAEQRKIMKAYTKWYQILLMNEKNFQQTIINRYNLYNKQLITQTQKMSNYFDLTKQFISSFISETSNVFIDIIVIKNQECYIINQDDEEVKLNLINNQSLLKQALEKKKQIEYLNMVEKKEFNQDIDLPFVENKTLIIKEFTNLHQCIFPILKKKSQLQSLKEIKLIIRITTKTIPLQQDFKSIIQNLADMILNSWKSFSKLHSLMKNLNQKLKNVNDNSQISEKTFNQLQYLQSKAFETNYVQTISDCFKHLNTIIKELFSYDKFSLFMYNQGDLFKLYDATKGNSNQQIIGYSQEKDDSLITEMISLKLEGNNIKFKQTIATVDDELSVKGKSIQDQVVIDLEAQQIDTSISCAITSFLSAQQNENIRYFIKLEKKLNKAKDQVAFDQKCDCNTILKSFQQICFIMINKIKILSQQVPTIKQVNADDVNNYSKISQENVELKKLIDIQHQMDHICKDIQEQKALEFFDMFEQKIKVFIQSVIPNAHYVKLFLSKDEQGNVIYTYHNEQIQQQNISISQVNKNEIKLVTQRSRSQNRLHNQKLIQKSNSQINDQMYAQNNIPSNLDDISSISGNDIYNGHNERNSLFIQENVNHQFQNNNQLTRQASYNFLNSSGSYRLKRNNQRKCDSKFLKRDKSAQSDLYQNALSQLSPNLINEEYNQQIPSQMIAQKEEENEIRYLNNDNQRIDIQPFLYQSILTQCLKSKQPILKRNVKNDKTFNQQLDSLILKGTDDDLVENAIYLPLYYQQAILGLIQIVNCQNLLNFTEHELDIMKIIGQKISNLLYDHNESQREKVLFKKQAEVSIMHTNLESQSVTQILTLANQLFQSKLSPLRAVNIFMRKTESFLKQLFGCNLAQILLVDSEQQVFLSIDKLKRNCLVERGSIEERSIASLVISQNEPFIYPINSDFILVENDNSNQPNTNIIGIQFFNYNIDIPLSNTNKIERMPTTYLALNVKDSQNQSIAVIELMMKENNFKFQEQDIEHLQLIADHLRQVFEYITKTGYLQQLSNHQTQATFKLFYIFQRKYQSYMKYFMRELISYKYGKMNILKNKILRTYLDKHQKLDHQFLLKIQQLLKLREKFQRNAQSNALQKLKIKIRQITEQRKNNATKCVQIMQKYQKLLKIRVKDTAFRYWNKEHNSILGIENINDSSLLNKSILEESSITSLLFQKSKATYKLRKLFNKFKLQPYFDTFAIKTLSCKYSQKLIRNVKMLRLIKLSKLINSRVKVYYKRNFDKFCFIIKHVNCVNQKLKRLVNRRQMRQLTFGVQKWHQISENTIRQELVNEKSFSLQLNEQLQDGNLLGMIMMNINSLFQSNFMNEKDILQSLQFKNFVSSLSKFIMNNSVSEQVIISLKTIDNKFAFFSQMKELYNFQIENSFQMVSVFEPIINESQNNLSFQEMNISFANKALSLNRHLNSFINNQDQLLNENASMHAKCDNNLDHIEYFDETDLIIQTLLQSKQQLLIQNIKDDQILSNTFKSRQINSAQQGLILPLIDHNQLIGTLELYTKTQNFIEQDQYKLKNYSKILTLGFALLRKQLQVLNKVQTVQQEKQMIIENQSENQKENLRSLREICENVERYTEKIMLANYCQVIFVPQNFKGKVRIYSRNEWEEIDLKQSYLESIIQTNSLRQITLPSSLLCPQTMRQSQSLNEKFESVIGLKFSAIKYIVLTKSHYSKQLIAYIEIGWNSLHDAINIHENLSYLEKQEQKVKQRFQDSINDLTKNIKLFTYIVEQKSHNFNINQKYVEYFWKWRALSQNQIGNHTFSNVFSPIMKKNKNHIEYMTEKVEVENNLFNNIYMPTRKSIVPCQLSYQRQSIQNEEDELQVEKAAKNKLISASLMIISVINKQHKKSQVSNAFSEWKSFILNSQVAESAFDKLLEINHKHSIVRYFTAVQILQRMFKKYYVKDTLVMLKSTVKKDQNHNFKQAFSDYHQESTYNKPFFNLDMSKLGGNDTQNFVDEVFQLKDINDENQDSEFSLGSGAQDIIKLKADDIIEKARNSLYQPYSHRK